MSTDAPVLDSETTLEFVGPEDGGWYRTQIPDWVALHPEMTHTAFRLYAILRSLILEKQHRKVRLFSYEQLAFLLPGVKGKPSSIDAVKDALRVLGRLGLVTNPDSDRLISSRGRGSIQTRRRYQLNDWPADGETAVWRNAFDKLDAFTEDWRETRSDMFPGRIEGGKKPQRNDQHEPQPAPAPETPEETAPPPAETNVLAGRFDGAFLPSDQGKKPSGEGNFPENQGLTCGDASPLKELPKGVTEEEEEDEPQRSHSDASPRDQTPEAVVRHATGATAAEARTLVDEIRGDPAVRSVAKYVQTLAANGDMAHRLSALRTPPPDTAPSAEPTARRPSPIDLQAQRLAAGYWQRHQATTAQSLTAVRRVVATALANGNDTGDLAAALDVLGCEQRAVSGASLQIALRQVRHPNAASRLPDASGRPSTTDQRVNDALALAAKYAAQEHPQGVP